MIAQIPRQPSTSADEGAAANELAARILEAGINGPLTANNRKFSVGQPMPNGIICTDEMVDNVEVYVNDVADVLISTGSEAWGIETGVKIPQVYEHMKGTVPAWVFDETTGILYVWVFKYGHALVEVFENQQLILYVLGLLDLLGLDINSISVDLRIVQPRGFHADGVIRSWVTGTGPIHQWRGQLRTAATVASNKNHAKTRSGIHCKNCRAKHACASAQQAGLLAIEYTNAPVPVDMDGPTLGTYLQIIHRSFKAIEDMKTGLEAQAKARLNKGEAIPGYELKPSYGNLDWAVDHKRIQTLEGIFGVDLFKTKPITPTQAINNAGIPKGIIATYAAKPERGSKLVADDGTEARRIFEQQPSKDS